MYFNERSGKSIHRGTVKFRLKSCRPSFHRYSETVPTGQIQLQNDFRNNSELKTKALKRKKAAGCIRGRCAVAATYLNCIRTSMGSQPSTPAGREAAVVSPPVSAQRTHIQNCTPIQRFRS